jgi:hypothetical protein
MSIPIEWKDAGRFTVCSIVDGRIYALVYWSEGFAARGPGNREPTAAGPGWFLVFSDDPDVHIRIDAPEMEPVLPGADDDDLDRAMRTAASAALAIIRNRLGE